MRRCAALLALALALGACGDGARAAPDDVALVASLCRVRDLAQDANAAERRFFGAPHRELHELAQRLQNHGDRGLAADVLEAKQVVEVAFAEGQLDPDLLADRLDRLADATRSAVASLGTDAPAC